LTTSGDFDQLRISSVARYEVKVDVAPADTTQAE
jgi:hypothetical protein